MRIAKVVSVIARAPTSFALAASLAVVGCGGKSGPTFSGVEAVGGRGTAGSAAAGGSATSGGTASAGTSSGGTASAGASSGGTSSAADPCFDATYQLVPAGKSCEVDSDCEAMPTSNCCGEGPIVGIAKRAREYEACYPAPTGCPQGLGCFSSPSTEDGQSADYGSPSFKLLCAGVNGGTKSCRTASLDSAEGTPWACTCFDKASCCAPVGDAGAP